MEKIDKKIDDGKPRTGFLIGLPQGADGQQDMANTCDDNAEYFDNQDERILGVNIIKKLTINMVAIWHILVQSILQTCWLIQNILVENTKTHFYKPLVKC